jgi:1-acyl-sn-glycerol-3-phosphate acyltransferase
LRGTQDMLPKGAKFPRFVPVTVRFGAPLDVASLVFEGEAVAENPRARRAVADAVVAEIQKLSGQEYTGVYNERPAEV